MTARTRAGIALVCLGIAAGLVLMMLSGGNATVGVVGLVLMGAAGIAGVAWAFYAVGRSEDRERAEQQRRS